jgi:hypothetical protein
LLVFIEPVAQSFSHGRVARGFYTLIELAPIEIAIEAPTQLMREADTDNLPAIVLFFGHKFPLIIFQSTT